MKYKIILIYVLSIVFLLIGNQARAQELLTLEDAVKIALERNYDIKLVSNDLRIDKNNVSRANAGMLPRVDALLTDNNILQNTRQTLLNGQTQERNGARNSNLAYGANLSWTIFDGFGMFARYDQLKELETLGEKELQQTILTTVGDVMTTYYNLVNQQLQLRAYDTATIISRQRLNTAQNRFIIGKVARLEVLNAQVDYNTDTTNLIQQKQLYQNAKIQLNELLARDVNIQFRVVDTIMIDDKLKLGTLSELVAKQNPTLQAAIINQRIAELDLKRTKAFRYPIINVNTGYNFANSTSALGFATQSTNHGLNYGLTASVNIFNGLLQHKNERNASITVQNSQLQYQKTSLHLNSQLATAFQTYLTSLALVDLEESNLKIAKKNLEITIEKYRLGSIAPIEFRQAQLNYTNATVRFGNSQYVAKLTEISLKEIAGNLDMY